jgi:DNA helicase II / ATP-dependent DNA helicase PcrA
MSSKAYKNDKVHMNFNSSTAEGLSAGLLANLNPPQKEAVQTLDGPLLILAGAGSGKTKVLTQRMCGLISTRRAAPDQILAVTFTNKAAKEMEHRIFKSLMDLGISVREPLWISTFHSFCVRVLRQNIELLEYARTFSIYDDSDQVSQIKKILQLLQINDKSLAPKTLRNRINTAKMLALLPEDLEKTSKVFFDEKTILVYKHYEIEMKKANALDFGDLLFKVYELFRMYPDVLEQYQEQFRYIMVDEYQDTNHIQYLLVQQLAQKHRNLCVVGDEDQSIYSWRGADITNILNFEKDFPEAKIIKLEQNYRSTQTIVNAATKLIKNNSQRKDKTLFTENNAGEKIVIREEKTEYDEAKWVIRKIHSMITEGEGTFSDYAIFYRTNAQSRVLEEQLRSMTLPYQIVGGVRFYERMEIKDIISYLKLIVNPADDVALKRVINVPSRGIGKTTVERLEELAFNNQLSMLKAMHKAVNEREFNAGTTSKLRGFLALMTDLTEQSTDHDMVDFYHILLEKTEYVLRLKAEESPEADARIQNLEELSNALSQFMKERPDPTLQSFLEEMALVSDIDSMEDTSAKVTLMTMHVSKGLEFPYVFIVGLEENLFPSGLSADADEESELEEERRLAYVGMTRARERLFLVYARARKVWGQEQFNPPSRFLKELPADSVQFSTALETPKFASQYAANPQNVQKQWYKAKTTSQADAQDFPDYDNADFSGAYDDASGGSAGADGFKKGQSVKHPTFGPGQIFQVEGTGDTQKVSVVFADSTIKKFVTKYARLEKI